jgi:hypothetical protein
MNKFICDQTKETGDPTVYGTPPMGWFSVIATAGGEPTRHFSSERAVAEYYAAKAGLQVITPVTQQDLNELAAAAQGV